MEEKVIIAKFGKTKVAQTEKQWRYNHGQKLKFEGVDLPANYEVHFSNSKTGTAKTRIGNADGVLIPQEYFVPGEMIYAWVYVEEDGAGVTRREVRIPIDQKAKPTDQQPLPEEQTVIEQAIEALNTAVSEIPDSINDALAAAKAAGTFDGTQIWWVFTGISNGAPDHDGRILRRALNGKEGEAPLIGDFVYGPAIGSANHKITDLYVIEEITGIVVFLKHLDSIKGEDGFDPEITVEEIPNGHRVSITSANGTETFDVMNGTFEVTGPLSMENYRLIELADGVDDTDAVNKAQVEQMVREGSGLFRGSFSTKASLNMAAWQSEDPTQPYYVDNNDYCVVLSDETQRYECWRYGYVIGSGWVAQYRINEAPMTAAQIAAINSGITSDRLVSLEQFKNAAQTKLSGIEAGAQVNKIEAIRAVNPSTGQYEELPIANKTVDIPQRGRNVWYTDAVMVASLKVLTRDLQGPSANPAVGDYVFGNSVSQGDIDSLFRIESISVIFAELSLIASFGGGGGGASSYSDLPDKPSINNVTLSGNKSLSDLGIEPEAFVVTITQSGSTYSADKTYSDTAAAISAGKRVVAVLNGYEYQLFNYVPNNYTIVFSANQGTAAKTIAFSLGDAVSITENALGTYSKPSGGIPKTDLASEVQTSLGKADTALQPGDVAEPYFVTYSTSDMAAWTCDKTYTQIVTAAMSGLPVVCSVVISGNPTLQISSVEVGSSMELIFRQYVGRGNSFRIEHDSTDFILSHTESIIPSNIGAVAVAQGVGHAGEFVVVGSDGNITSVTMSVWQGGSY